MSTVAVPDESGWSVVGAVLLRLLDLVACGGRPWRRLVVIVVLAIILVVVVRVPLPVLPMLPELPPLFWLT